MDEYDWVSADTDMDPDRQPRVTEKDSLKERINGQGANKKENLLMIKSLVCLDGLGGGGMQWII